MKFVVNPPTNTTTSTGKPCQRVGVPCIKVNALIGASRGESISKQALITPETSPHRALS